MRVKLSEVRHLIRKLIIEAQPEFLPKELRQFEELVRFVFQKALEYGTGNELDITASIEAQLPTHPDISVVAITPAEAKILSKAGNFYVPPNATHILLNNIAYSFMCIGVYIEYGMIPSTSPDADVVDVQIAKGGPFVTVKRMPSDELISLRAKDLFETFEHVMNIIDSAPEDTEG